MHLDWQGGWPPTLREGEVRQFNKPAHAGWEPKMEGDICTGYVFGKKNIMARIYNKSKQCAVKHITWYPEYLKQKVGDAFNAVLDVWRLEFEITREGIKSFYLETAPDVDDEDAILDAEMEGEDLPGVGTIVNALHHAAKFWEYFSRHWLRLVMDDGDKNRARGPTHPTWQVL